MEKTKPETEITINPVITVDDSRHGERTPPRPRPAIAIDVNGREHVVHYPTCETWLGPN